MTQAIFKAILNNEGAMVAGIAAIPEGGARFFIVQKHENQDQFVGRVSNWIREQGAGGLQMQPPDVLPRGVPAKEFILRIRVAMGVDKSIPHDAAEFDVEDPKVVFSGDEGKPAPN